jgi:hypothetical protein
MKYQIVKTLILTVITVLFVTMSARSQTPVKNYEAEWKKVDAFIAKELPKSALTEVKKIYALAKKEKQEAQLIKSLVMMTTLQVETREDNQVLSIAEVEKEIPGSAQPATSLLKSLLATMYKEYFEEIRYELYNRTNTTQFKKEDISTWTADDFHKKIGELYVQSIQETKLLQQTKLDRYNAILVKGNMRHLRPTLYDLLAQRALMYFENDERDISKPAYAFEIDQASAFDPAADFITRKFNNKDELSLHYKALLVYQELIRFHINDAKHDALIDVDLQRLAFVRNKSVHPDKDQLYLNAINHVANQYGNLPAASQAWFMIASYYENKALLYKPFADTTNRYARVKAKEICEKIVAQKDSSEGKINCANLLQSINQTDLDFSLEKVNVPGQPFRMYVGYRNFPTLYLRIVKPDAALKKQMEDRYGEKYWAAIANATPLKSWQQTLPATNDLQRHTTEIKVDGLPVGEYLVIASTQKDFKDKKSVLGARFFYVSNISYVHSQSDFFLLNRDNGQPLANANVNVWEQKYDYATSKNIKTKIGSYKTNENGFFQKETRKAQTNYGSYNYALDITHGDDHLFMDDWLYEYYYNNKNSDPNKYRPLLFMFIDRAIYRPGQTIYFKGIVLQRDGEDRSNVVTDYTTTIVLRDANGQAVDSLKMSTNEFGSFNGKFQLPQTGLTGNFTLSSVNGGYASFRVEEYKRPKFFVEYEPIKGTYKVNDKIKVTGLAKAYAGNNIDGAMVKYRVVREARWMYPWMSWRWWPRSEPQEIAHGDLKTDKDGKFFVEFTAIPDLKMDKKNDPVFTYTIYADVTDINGETRSGEESVEVSYKALKIAAGIPDRLPADSLTSLSIFTQNMSGQFEPASINVKITKLQEEKRLIRDRYWERPDQFVMSKEEYIRLFPHDEYDNETDMREWQKGEKQFDKTDSTHADGKWKLNNNSTFKPGFYVIEIETKDKYGETVKDVRYIELFDEKARTLNRPMYAWLNYKKQPKEPGEVASFDFGTSAEDVFVVQQVDRGAYTDKEVKPVYTFMKTSNQVTQLDFPTWPRQNFDLHWAYVKHNRVFVQNGSVFVPRLDETLNIEYATYRDKTEPGSQEKWKLKISGYKNEKVAAEVLASMYDASLDQFAGHYWPSLSLGYSHYDHSFAMPDNFKMEAAEKKYAEGGPYKTLIKEYDRLFFDEDARIMSGYYNFSTKSRLSLARPMAQMDGAVAMEAAAPPSGGMKDGDNRREYKRGNVTDFLDKNEEAGNADQTGKPKENNATEGVTIRKNFNETAFFFPDLRTDAEGNIEFSFVMPEALTKWKFMSLAHTKNGASSQSTKEIVTQKELMVQPNAPRFLREGDKIEFSSKIVNLTGKELTGQAELQLVDATTNQPVDGWFKNMMPKQFFTVPAGQSEAVRFPVEVPYLFNKALLWRIVAKAGNFSDGEENSMPVLTNRMLVTETLPLPMRGAGSKTFTFDKLLTSGKSETLQHHALTLEYTSNPAWYAVQALPYLMEYPYECAEQTWNRYYANSLATFIANSSPKIKQVFEQWKTKDTAALLSNLQKNQELKALLLEETPWVLQAKTEAEQKKNIALLFDMIKMSQQLTNSYEKLKQMQSSNGGFVWFTGGPDDRYITQYIVTGIGHLKKLKTNVSGQNSKLEAILKLAIPYLDAKLKQDYDDLVKYKTDMKKYTPGYTTIQYLYMRSFFPEYKIAAASQTAYTYFRERAQKTWTTQSKYMQGMTTLALFRTGDAATPAAILKSLKETSINNEELGMYWKDVTRGWFWYEAPIERQALLIEAFQEAGKDTKTVDDLRTWLLKNKQTNNWESTKATAEACYALLLQGTEWLSNEPVVEVKLGTTVIKSTDNKQEAGTGYFKQVIDGAKVKPEMGNITVTVSPTTGAGGQSTNSATWGGVYWQYFEDLDKITTAATPLKLVKKLFVEKNTDRGPVLTPVNNGDILKIGDKIKVRIELRVDRDMEYVHMKDMRASSLEPVNVLSSYKWQNGLGYYESTRDASTNFFFSSLRKGTYVFEYPLFVTHAGNFSNGITSIQCMYAPEFTSHSEGIRINVE